MELAIIVLFALAVSADGFVVGVAYGINRIRIPLLSLIIISLASAFAVTVSMVCGKGLAVLMSPVFASRIGAAMLIIIGIYFLMQSCRERINKLDNDFDTPLVSININALGIIVQILKQPSSADVDCSGEISPREAFFLGVALAMDALGAGLGAAMTGLNILITAVCVGMVKFILVNSGIMLGGIMKNQRWRGAFSAIPGLILITIGIMEFIG